MTTMQTNLENTIKIPATVQASTAEPTHEIPRSRPDSHARELRVQHEQFAARVDFLEWLEEDSALQEQLGIPDVGKVRELKQRLAKRLKWIEYAREKVEPGFLQRTDVSNF